MATMCWPRLAAIILPTGPATVARTWCRAWCRKLILTPPSGSFLFPPPIGGPLKLADLLIRRYELNVLVTILGLGKITPKG